MGDTLTGTSVESDGWDVDSFGVSASAAETIKADLSDGETLPATDPAPAATDTAAKAAPAAGDAEADDAAEDAPDAEAGDATDDAGETATDAKAEGEGEKPPKRKSAAERKAALQSEINALTRAKYEEQRAIDALRRQRESLEAGTPDPKRPEPKAQKTETSEAPTRPSWAAFEAEGKSWDDYVAAFETYQDARVEHTLTQERQARTKADNEARREAHHREVMSQYHTRLEQARTAHADFDTVVGAFDAPRNAFLTDVVLHHEAGAETLYQLALHKDESAILASLPLTNPMMDAVREMEAPADLLLHFARHPEDTERLARLSPRSALVALGKLVAQVEGAKNGSPAPATVSKAKPPIGHLSGSRPVAAAASGDERDDDPSEDILDYIARKNAADGR